MHLAALSLFSSLIFPLLPSVAGLEPVQHRVTRRTPSPILDTCAYVEAPLSDILNSISCANSSSTSGEDVLVQQCLCTSSIQSFLRSSRLDSVDATDVERAFEAYVVESHAAQRCIYPSHAVAQCSRDDPCGFECTDSFQLVSSNLRGRKTKTCTCAPPNTICGGQCGTFPTGCPSTTVERNDALDACPIPITRERASPHRPFARPPLRPSPRPHGAFQSDAAAPTGSFSNSQAQEAQDAGCSPHESLCGAYAPRGRRTTECIDTQRSLESCGGCIIPPPSPFSAFESGYAKREEEMGVDCSALEGVADVSCSGGRCVVQTCEVGWMVAPSGENCVPNTSGNAASANAGESGALDNERYVPARMPLLRPTSTTTSSTDATSSDSATPTSTETGKFQGADAASPSASPSPSATPEGSARFSNARTGVNHGPELGPGPGLGLGLGLGENEAGINDKFPNLAAPALGVPGASPGTGFGLGLDMADAAAAGVTDPSAPKLGFTNLATGVPDVDDVPTAIPRLHLTGFHALPGGDATGDDTSGVGAPDPASGALDFALAGADAADAGANSNLIPATTPAPDVNLDLGEALGDGTDVDPGSGAPAPGRRFGFGRFFAGAPNADTVTVPTPIGNPPDAGIDPAGLSAAVDLAASDAIGEGETPDAGTTLTRLRLDAAHAGSPASTTASEVGAVLDNADAGADEGVESATAFDAAFSNVGADASDAGAGATPDTDTLALFNAKTLPTDSAGAFEPEDSNARRPFALHRLFAGAVGSEAGLGDAAATGEDGVPTNTDGSNSVPNSPAGANSVTPADGGDDADPKGRLTQANAPAPAGDQDPDSVSEATPNSDDATPAGDSDSVQPGGRLAQNNAAPPTGDQGPDEASSASVPESTPGPDNAIAIGNYDDAESRGRLVQNNAAHPVGDQDSEGSGSDSVTESAPDSDNSTPTVDSDDAEPEGRFAQNNAAPPAGDQGLNGASSDSVPEPTSGPDNKTLTGVGTGTGTDADNAAALPRVRLSGLNASPPDVQDGDVDLPTNPGTGSVGLPTGSLPEQEGGAAAAVTDAVNTGTSAGPNVDTSDTNATSTLAPANAVDDATSASNSNVNSGDVLVIADAVMDGASDTPTADTSQVSVPALFATPNTEDASLSAVADQATSNSGSDSADGVTDAAPTLETSSASAPSPSVTEDADAAVSDTSGAAADANSDVPATETPDADAGTAGGAVAGDSASM